MHQSLFLNNGHCYVFADRSLLLKSPKQSEGLSRLMLLLKRADRNSALHDCRVQNDWKSMHSYFRIDSVSSLEAEKNFEIMSNCWKFDRLFRNRWTNANRRFSFWGFYDRRSAIKWKNGVVLSRKRQKLRSYSWGLASQAWFEKICGWSANFADYLRYLTGFMSDFCR